MTGGVMSGGLLFILAAVVWGAAVVPAFLRHREVSAAEKAAEAMTINMRVMAEAARESDEDKLVQRAREALDREKIMNSQTKRDAADLQSELAKVRAEQARAELRAKQAERARIAEVRRQKLNSAPAKAVRGFAALLVVLGVLAALVGVGLGIAGHGWLILMISAGAAVLSFATLVALAPGRVKAPVIQAEVEAEAAATEVVEYAPQDETPKFVDHSREHRQAQAQAAARIARARALSRARSAQPAPRENQQDSMLLQEAKAQVRAAQIAGKLEKTKRVTKPAQSDVNAQERITKSAGATTNGPARERQEVVSRLRQMGVIGDTSDGAFDVSATLNRRRNAS